MPKEATGPNIAWHSSLFESPLDFWTDRFNSAAMKGRPKEFDAEAAVQQATDLFWRYGYKATSLSDLLRTMNISKSSFYAEFKSKEALFKKCFAFYVSEREAWWNETLAATPTTEDFLRKVFAVVVEDASSEHPKGCLIANSATEFGQHEPAFCHDVQEAYHDIQRFLETAIKRGIADGEIDASESPKVLARYLTVTINGLLTMIKGGMTPGEARAVEDKIVRSIIK